MSLKIRLGLMAGASLAAMLGATGASAQTCTPNAATVSGSSSAADTVTCLAGTFATGIAYSSSGDLSVSMIANGATVNSPITANGVDITGNGADNVTFNSSVGGLTGGVGTAGAVLDVTSGSGDITIITAGVTGTQAGTTYGIRARSSGGGDIAISRAVGGANNNVAGGQAAIAASTTGGNIGINITAPGFTQGRLRGILAETSGAGTINIAVSGNVSASATDGIAAIDTITGTGATLIALNAGTMSGGAGWTIRSVSAGAVTVQYSPTAFVTVSGRVDFSGVAGGVTWTGANGSWLASGASVLTAVADTVSIGGGGLASGGSISFGGGNDTFSVSSTFDLSGLLDLGAGADVLNVLTSSGTALNVSNGAVDLGIGADTVNVAGTLAVNSSTFSFGADNDILNVTGVFSASDGALDFGSGTDVLNQDGTAFPGGLTTISALETFDNAGVIYLGGQRSFFGDDATDALANDLLRITGGAFTGSGASRFVLDANLGTGGSQIGCATVTVADCVDFTGATTAGSTLLTVQDISFSVDGGTLNTVITLVQGSSAAEHFSLDPTSTYYAETPQGPAIRKPLVAYQLVYDAANQRHVLVGSPTDEIYQVGTFAAAAQETWRATAGSWLTRQADLRATPGGLQPSLGVWGKVGAQSGEREASASYDLAGLTFNYDLNQKQRIAHLLFGADLVATENLVAGGMIGFVRSDVEFEATPTEAVSAGFTGGLYASYVAGPLFIDGLVNLNMLHIKAKAPQMALGLDVPLTFDLKSLGAQIEAGYRLGMGSGLFVEPLVGVSYVGTKFDDALVPGGSGTFDFEDKYESLRIGAGARVGMDGELMGMISSYSLTGRYWDEGEGSSAGRAVTANGSSVDTLDEFAGGFSEAVASLNLYTQDGGVSGFVTLGGKVGEDYQAVDGSAGVRVRW